MKRVRLWVSCLLGVWMTGCITISHNRIEKTEPFTMTYKVERKLKIFSRWKGDVETNFKKQRTDVMKGAANKLLFETELKATECCDIVEGPNEADIIVDGTEFVPENLSAVFFCLMSASSFYILPSWITGEINLSVHVKGNGQEKTYKLYDSYLIMQWLPFVVAMPFVDSAQTVEDDMQQNAYHHLLTRMKNDGFFK